MIDNNKGKGGEFDDDGFEGDDFDDAYFDETVEDAGIDDLPETEEGFEGEDFEDDWSEEEIEDTGKKGKKNKKEKSLTSSGKKKGSSNTLIIIGAVVVGAVVMLWNLSKPPPGAVSGKPVDTFKSVLNVGGIMDGTLFGDKPKDPTAEMPEEEQGFLTKVPEETNPPQPAPIAPEDTSLPLTPMPGETGTDGALETPSADAPRGPDDVIPTADGSVPVVPVEGTPETMAEQTPPTETASADAPSAQDILDKAMADRVAEQDGETPAAETTEEASVEDVAAETAAPEETKPEEMPVAELAPTIDAQEVKALESKLEGRIDELLARMDKIESDLGAVRDSKGGDTKDIEETVQSLKDEIAELKNRPAAPAPEKKSTPKKAAPKAEPVEEVSEEPAPAPAPKKTAAPKPAATAPVATTAGGWELRAAQPGRAWVSPPGSRDMQSVVVGDTLNGIGKVTGIIYQNGQWTVQGTQGAIRQ